MSDSPPQADEPPASGMDLAGVGKAMQAIPQSAWAQLVDTACTTLDKALSPITETTHGIGRLIKAKFDRLIDVEKVMAAESIHSARQKARRSGKPSKDPRPHIFLRIIENTSNEIDIGIREL